MTVFVGLDIGGTKIMVAAADHEGNILRRARADTSTSLETDRANIHRMIAEVAAEEEIIGLGAAIDGPLDWEQGIVSPLHQPAWRDVPLKAMMESKWGCAFRVDVDTNIAAVGESSSREKSVCGTLSSQLQVRMPTAGAAPGSGQHDRNQPALCSLL